MTVRLVHGISTSYCTAANVRSLFRNSEIDDLRQLEKREQPPLGTPGESCATNLFFGFFFDGTKNNYVQAETGKNHSNVARLYDCYPGLSVKGVLPESTEWEYNRDRYTHFFRTYIPGVASPFKEVGDSGEGMTLTMGASTGRGGQARIAWGLLQAVNNVHRYFHKRPMIEPTEAQNKAMWKCGVQ